MNAPFRFMGSHGIILFLFLIAFAMVRMSPPYSILLLLPAAMPYVLPRRLVHAAGYLGVALTVCKNE